LRKIYEQIKNNPASAEEQSLKFLVKYCNEQSSNKCRTISKVHFASRLFTYYC